MMLLPAAVSHPAAARAAFTLQSTTPLHCIHDVPGTTTVLVSVDESWRQYVPLVVSCLVIVDILLGSPFANAVLGAARPQGDNDEDDGENVKPTGWSPPWMENPSTARGRERVDTSAVAQAAIDKAQATLDLRNYLDAQKTDWDRMDDMRKEMDRTMEDLDTVLEEKKNRDYKEVEE